jgi:uncharacterized protein (TIGR00255 family)
MTGYGRGEHSQDGIKMTVELRSVNRKQAEILVRLPGEIEGLETRLREELNRTVSRGRVECQVVMEKPGGRLGGGINREVAAAFAVELRALAQDLGLTGGVTLEALIRCPGVVETETASTDPDTAWPRVEPAFRQAVKAFNAMRDREGSALEADLGVRIASLKAGVGRILVQAPEVQRRFRDQLLQRIRAAGLESIAPDDERLLKEVVFFADRSDVAEELARLESHFAQFEDTRRATEPVGRKLDFLAQEMNREVNTIGSKANDALISGDVVLLKTELERFREQAQNVE